MARCDGKNDGNGASDAVATPAPHVVTITDAGE